MRQLIIEAEAEAEADIDDAFDWYEKQRTGLGRAFELCLESALRTVQARPKMFRKVFKNVRRVLIDRFPYGVLYT